MTAQVIDGRKIAHNLATVTRHEIEQLGASGIVCGLATIVLGDSYSSLVYQRRLGRISTELGVSHRQIVLSANTSQGELLDTIQQLNNDTTVSGILVLRPLPEHISEVAVYAELSPIKDIEAVHPENAGLLALGTPRYVPSTAASAFHVLDTWLDESGEDRVGFYQRSRIVVVGRSNNVGKPAVSLAYDRQASVTSIDKWASLNNQLGSHTRRADVLLVAAGVPGLIRSEHIREGAVVLDVGINPMRNPRTGEVRMVGDVVFGEVAARARAITPVPGGIGPVTDVWLLRNIATAARLQSLGHH